LKHGRWLRWRQIVKRERHFLAVEIDLQDPIDRLADDGELIERGLKETLLDFAVDGRDQNDEAGMEWLRLDDMLTIVEHEQQPAIPERSDQARNRIIGANVETEHLRDGTGAQRPPNTFEQTGAARSQIGLPHPPDVTAMLAISMICFGHHDGFPRKIVCRQIRGQFDCLVSSIRVQKIQACVDLPQFHKIQYTLQSC